MLKSKQSEHYIVLEINHTHKEFKRSVTSHHISQYLVIDNATNETIEHYTGTLARIEANKKLIDILSSL